MTPRLRLVTASVAALGVCGGVAAAVVVVRSHGSTPAAAHGAVLGLATSSPSPLDTLTPTPVPTDPPTATPLPPTPVPSAVPTAVATARSTPASTPSATVHTYYLDCPQSCGQAPLQLHAGWHLVVTMHGGTAAEPWTTPSSSNTRVLQPLSSTGGANPQATFLAATTGQSVVLSTRGDGTSASQVTVDVIP